MKERWVRVMREAASMLATDAAGKVPKISPPSGATRLRLRQAVHRRAGPQEPGGTGEPGSSHREGGGPGVEPRRVRMIDSDLGLSGKSADGREGFRELVSEVSLGHAGIVLCYEASRLARNNADWYALWICAP